MNVADPPKAFFRDLKKVKDHALKEAVEQIIETVAKAQSKKDISELKKLKGYKIHYRIKIGTHRIGITIVGDIVTFCRFLPRKDFYKYFP